jgi:AdoMet-dependent heme synthase
MTTPEIVSWNVTQACNLACAHCYLDATRRREPASDELDPEEGRAVVRQVAALAPGAMLVLTGGEPLLRRDLEGLVREAAQGGLLPVVGTNGLLLDRERADALGAAGAAGVGISLDSATPAFHDRLRGLPGAWQRALRGVRAARVAGLAVQLQATLFAENRPDLEALADIAEVEGALALNVFFLVCTGRGVTQTDLSGEAYERALEAVVDLERRRGGLMIRARCAPYVRRLLGLRAGEGAGSYTGWSGACLAGKSYCRITPHGRVTACPYVPEEAGDLRRATLGDIWTGARGLRRLREEIPGGKCGGCDFRLSCGGCRARALAMHGDLLAEDPKCAYRPPAHAVPEARPVPPATHATPVWSAEARDLLARIPGFVRERVRRRLEAEAARGDAPVITAEFMRARRPGPGALFRRPGPAS